MNSELDMLHQAKLIIIHDQIARALDEINYLGKHAIREAPVVTDDRHRQHRALPLIVVLYLSNRHIEVLANTIFDASERHPLGLQIIRGWNAKFDLERSEEHTSELQATFD